MKFVNLKEYVESLESGKRPKGGATVEGVPSLGGEHINSYGGFNLNKDKLKYVPNEYFDSLKKGIIKNNDVLIVKDGATTGKVAYVDSNFPLNNACINEHVFLIRTKKELNSKYLFYYLYSEHGQHQVLNDFRGATVGGISKEFIDINIYLPKYEEQLKIISILDKAKELIDKRKAQIEALDELVKSRFIEMFGDPITNPKEWNTSKLGDICTISRGGSPRPIDNFLGGPIPWIKIGDATKGDNIYLNKTKEGIIEEGVKKSRLIRKGGLIFANCGVSLGFARILKIDGCIHDGWLAFEGFDDSLDSVFFLKSLNYCTEYFRRIAPDGTQPNLNTNIMRQYIQILPPMELQKQFTNFIKQVDKLKFEMEKSLKELENNFNSLMQRAFKGELFK